MAFFLMEESKAIHKGQSGPDSRVGLQHRWGPGSGTSLLPLNVLHQQPPGMMCKMMSWVTLQ